MDEIKFLVDRVDEPRSRGMLPDVGGRALDIVVGVSSEGFKKMMGTLISQVASAVGAADLSKAPFDLSEVTFTVNVGTDGELSIMSLAKGSISTNSGIEVKLVRK